jgi:hypothetical protein
MLYPLTNRRWTYHFYWNRKKCIQLILWSKLVFNNLQNLVWHRLVLVDLGLIIIQTIIQNTKAKTFYLSFFIFLICNLAGKIKMWTVPKVQKEGAHHNTLACLYSVGSNPHVWGTNKTWSACMRHTINLSEEIQT